jgi:hypothetical protein
VTILWAALMVASPAAGQRPACEPAPPGVAAAEVLARASAAMGVPDSGEVLHFASGGRRVQDFQSDRSYPPFFSAMESTDTWYDPAAGVEKTTLQLLYPRGGIPPMTTWVDRRSTWMERQGQPVEAPTVDASMRPLRTMNPWAVVTDWRTSGDARTAGLCPYRDDLRLVLERAEDGLPERLFLDRESGLPVKLDRTVPDITWGQLHEEILWSTWLELDGRAAFPAASFRILGGRVTRERTVGTIELTPASEASLVTLPAKAQGPPATSPFQDPERVRPDTVRLADDVFLLSQRWYNEALIAAGDTVWVMDATLSEARARQDAAWIATLFPQAHHVAVVVTDLAWPHIGGVRFWVSRGATIYSHTMSRDFLTRLVERRWTLDPDALERARTERAVPFRFVAVDGDGVDVGGGRLAVRRIDGGASEGALMVQDTRSGFLWAGDWIQSTEQPTMYATDVVRAVRREGLRPLRVGAQHIAVTPWATIEELNGTGR